MLKKMLYTLVVVFMVMFANLQSVNAEEIHCKVNDSLSFHIEYINKENNLLLPMREFFESLGAKVDWNDKTRTVTILYDNNKFDLPVDSYSICINSSAEEIDKTIIIENNKSFIPLETISKLLRMPITLNRAENTVIINYMSSYSDFSENWPIHVIKDDYTTIVATSLQKYKEQNIDYTRGMQKYTTEGDYLNYGRIKHYRETERVRFDDQGIPMVKYGTDYYYNPVTVSQYALSLYGKYLNNDDVYNEFIDAVEKLLLLQDERGAFSYDFSFRYYLTGENYELGWVSGMAQGQALSVLSRAYQLTNNARYLEAGNRALEFLITSVEQKGVMDTLEDLDASLKHYIIFEEYLSNPASYTLNGYMFTLLGLYDWANINQNESYQSMAKDYFTKGNETLVSILPYYDIGGFTAYDLGFITHNKEPHVGVGYHAVHIELLHALYSVTGLEPYRYYEELWKSYVNK